jgi:hypothetical protein
MNADERTGAFYPLGQTRLPAVWASLAMALSSVSVILNSLLLRATFRLPTVVREAQRPAATTRAATPTSWTGSEAGALTKCLCPPPRLADRHAQDRGAETGRAGHTRGPLYNAS